jgi:hypothetical protein
MTIYSDKLYFNEQLIHFVTDSLTEFAQSAYRFEDLKIF